MLGIIWGDGATESGGTEPAAGQAGGWARSRAGDCADPGVS